jgi:hypothetical protein
MNVIFNQGKAWYGQSGFPAVDVAFEPVAVTAGLQSSRRSDANTVFLEVFGLLILPFTGMRNE